MNGLFITFEGGDGAGKSTLMDGVYQTLISKGEKVLKTHAPGATAAGRIIRSLLLNQGDIPLNARAELFLFLADRAEHVEKIILPALNRGEIVLCDRYNDSTIAYQGVGRDLGIGEVTRLCQFATNSLEPNLTLYLDLDPQIGLQRVQVSSTKDRIEAEELPFHEKIRTAFHVLADKYPKRLRILDANQSKELLLKNALEAIHALVF